MNQTIQQSIKPQFHYSYKSEAVILDSQYNYEGNMLAVCNSQGYIYLYSSEGQQPSKQPFFTYIHESKKQLKNCAILKISWSLPQIGMLASCNIYQNISLFKVKNKSLMLFKEIQTQSIPISLIFYPSQKQCLVTVGFSDGSIKMYNRQLETVENVQAHLQVVNYLAWDTNAFKFQKNKWVQNNFGNIHKSQSNSSFLLSCSSDMSIKIWKYTNSKLKLLGTYQKAHQKHVRMIDWKSHFFNDDQRIFVSCSEDFSVKIWSVKIVEDKCVFSLKGSTIMKGPVYKAKYNFIGNLLMVSYCNEQQQKVETKIFKQINGTLCQQLKFQN